VKLVPSAVALARQIHEDWEAHYRDWTMPGFRALAVNRFGTWLQQRPPRSPIRAAFRQLHLAMFRYVRNHYGIELPATTVVGRRVVIGHQGGIVIHGSAVIGDECVIRQNVTIGAASHARTSEAPKLGRRVQVGCGAVIVGAVTIGDDARLGPNVVVMADVPPRATVFVDRPRVVSMEPAPSGRELETYAGGGAG
jgi:serine O-acetyltransferase